MEERIKEMLRATRQAPEEGLAENIWRTIELRQKKNARLKLWALSGLGVISLFAAVPAVSLALKELSGSGFYEYLSLLSTEPIMAYWQELGLTLLESLPMMSIILSLSLIFVFFLSLRQAGRQFNRLQLTF